MLLDAGCGSGLFSYMAIETGAQVIGVDAASGLLEVARQRQSPNNLWRKTLRRFPSRIIVLMWLRVSIRFSIQEILKMLSLKPKEY
jgi:ribosomal protein L11 methylase PrmA